MRIGGRVDGVCEEIGVLHIESGVHIIIVQNLHDRADVSLHPVANLYTS
ncbi:MAG: hypothetical protein WC313_02770 [Candidatus Kapaibacterium sp.]|jgi:hypothetical protein|nr:hypothetical protein [Candidatus Kapabacteria bacterium]